MGGSAGAMGTEANCDLLAGEIHFPFFVFPQEVCWWDSFTVSFPTLSHGTWQLIWWDSFYLQFPHSLMWITTSDLLAGKIHLFCFFSTLSYMEQAKWPHCRWDWFLAHCPVSQHLFSSHLFHTSRHLCMLDLCWMLTLPFITSLNRPRWDCPDMAILCISDRSSLF